MKKIKCFLAMLFFLTPIVVFSQSSCNNTGVTRNSIGTYSFAHLVVDSTGNIVNADSRTCKIHLYGVNWGALFLESAQHIDSSTIAWYTSHLHINIVREAYNAYWWNTDVYVPNQKMHFRQWLQTVVKWDEENGNYVILDNATQFHNPPCGNDSNGYNIKFCPSQDQSTKNNPSDSTENAWYEPTALTALKSLAQIYAKDPAIIFDVWNEPAYWEVQGIDTKTYFQSMNERIDTVRKYAPNALIMIFDRFAPDMISGKYPNYIQPNLMWDNHIYTPLDTSNHDHQFINFAKVNGQAFIDGEWGAADGIPDPSTQMIPFLKETNANSAYFQAGFLAADHPNHPTALNSIGYALAKGYANLFGNPTSISRISNFSPQFDLLQNYPNPFNPSTEIHYQLAKPGFVTLKVFDALGKEVKILVNQYQSRGNYSVKFDASQLASGVYLYELKTNDFNSTRKMIFVK